MTTIRLTAAQAAVRWLAGELDDAALVAEVRGGFEALVGMWRQSRAAAGEVAA